jgi:formamidopyrimidine-DNA glycosylase
VPELPEVETVVRDIRPSVAGSKFVRIDLAAGATRTLEGNLQAVNRRLAQRRIQSVGRRAKYIVFYFDQGDALTVHLRMTGRLYLADRRRPSSPYVRAFLKLDRNKELHFEDTRRFGKIKYWPKVEALDQKLGIEPLSKEFTEEILWQLLRASDRQLKPFLLDQTIVAGLGNIYVDEALWFAELHPLRKASDTPRLKATKLWQGIRSVLKAGIKHQGTTFDSFYFGEGKKGKYAQLLKVFDQTGNACCRCGATIVKTRVAQRGTHICPKCQK